MLSAMVRYPIKLQSTTSEGVVIVSDKDLWEVMRRVRASVGVVIVSGIVR